MSQESKIEFLTRVFGIDFPNNVLDRDDVIKSPEEVRLFNKWKFYMKRTFISRRQINRFANDLKTLKLASLLLLFNITSAQSVIVPAGNSNETFGQVFPIMQSDMADAPEVSLGLPKFEKPTKTYIPKPIVKKKNFIQKFLQFFQNLLTKNKKTK